MEARFLLRPSARHLGMPQVPVPLSQEITRPGLEARPQWSYSFWRYKNGYSFQIESNDRLRGWSHPRRPGKPVSPWGWLTGAWRNTNSWKAASWLKCPSQNGRYIIYWLLLSSQAAASLSGLLSPQLLAQSFQDRCCWVLKVSRTFRLRAFYIMSWATPPRLLSVSFPTFGACLGSFIFLLVLWLIG